MYRLMLLFRRIEKHAYVPGGKYTVPPPVLAAASIARLTAGLSIVFPSPRAPNARTSYTGPLFPARALASPVVVLHPTTASRTRTDAVHCANESFIASHG